MNLSLHNDISHSMKILVLCTRKQTHIRHWKTNKNKQTNI